MPRFDLEQFLQIMQDYHSPGLPGAAHCAGPGKHPLVDKYDLSSLNLVMSGAARE